MRKFALFSLLSLTILLTGCIGGDADDTATTTDDATTTDSAVTTDATAE